MKFVNKQKKFLGYFATKQEASIAYDKERALQAKWWKQEMQNKIPQKAIDNIQ